MKSYKLVERFSNWILQSAENVFKEEILRSKFASCSYLSENPWSVFFSGKSWYPTAMMLWLPLCSGVFTYNLWTNVWKRKKLTYPKCMEKKKTDIFLEQLQINILSLNWR